MGSEHRPRAGDADAVVAGWLLPAGGRWWQRPARVGDPEVAPQSVELAGTR